MAKKLNDRKVLADQDFQEILDGLDQTRLDQKNGLNRFKGLRRFLVLLVALLIPILFYKFYFQNQQLTSFQEILGKEIDFKKKYKFEASDYKFKWTREIFDNLPLASPYESPGDKAVTMDELVKLVGQPTKVEEEFDKVTFYYDAIYDVNYPYHSTSIWVVFQRDYSSSMNSGKYYAVQKSAMELPNEKGELDIHIWTQEEFDQLAVEDSGKGERGITLTKFLTKGFGVSTDETVGYDYHSFTYSSPGNSDKQEPRFYVSLYFKSHIDDYLTLDYKYADIEKTLP